MGALRGGAHHVQPRTRSSFSSAREALRAMASRATDLRMRGRPI
uniref:Uncharacterized protein n=1 Tax=Nelumbo nucifera TaxID=4432 RepID=A0A822XH31_NELNU|nr:TPA_asm: hypothetical protein HUJ06_020725 [Nelumbo nucifera]